MSLRINWMLLCFALGFLQLPGQVCIPHSHAHNDYVHRRPLFEALESGFTSIEVDVFLHKGELVVSHVGVGLNCKKKLQALYLQPLQQRAAASGFIYADSTPVVLMIDFKSNGSAAFRRLKDVIAPYRNLITLYKDGKVLRQGAVNLLISGSKPFADALKEDTLIALLDAGTGMLADTAYDAVIGRYSDPWQKYFTWRGRKTIPPAQKAVLDSLVAAAHAKGKHIRFYHIPDKARVWKALLNAGVDWINTDKLSAFCAFYQEGY